LAAFFFRFGAFFAAPFEAAALARLRLAFMRSNPQCRRNAGDSMKVETESRMELRQTGCKTAFFWVKQHKNGVAQRISHDLHRRFPGESGALQCCAVRFAPV
jgi:hypothetical protein